MRIIDLFRKKAAAPTPEHAVIVEFKYHGTDLQPIFDLGDRLKEAISALDVGEYDGNEVTADGSEGTLYMYGPDADALYNAVAPILLASTFMQGAKVRLRYGKPGTGAPQIELRLP